jgi:tRNA A-37 threonylcarbamoyl transferase component Bud32
VTVDSTHNSSPAGGGAVRFVDASAEALLRPHLKDLSDPNPDDWTIVKQNVSRTVYRGCIEGRDVYLKHYHGRSWDHRLRRALGYSEAMHEFRLAMYLQSRDVPTAAPLAARCDRQVEWFLTRAVAPAEPCDGWHDRQLRLGTKGLAMIRRCSAALGELIGRMHRADVVHSDLHCGNVLVRTDDPELRLVLMDLHRAYHRRRLSRRRKAANLAHLYHDRCYFTTRTDRLRFLRHYIVASGSRGSVRGWLYLIEKFALRHTRRQHVQRARRARGLNRYFAPMSLPDGWRGHVVLASKRHMGGSAAAEVVFTRDAWREALHDVDALFSAPNAEGIKDGRFARIVRRRLRIGEHEVDVFLKRQKPQFRKFLADGLRPSRALRAFHHGHALLTRRIATALPLAALERRSGPFLRDSLLITETVPSPHLYDFMNTWLSVPPRGDTPLSVPQQRQLAQEVLWQLGRMLQQLHDNRFSHRDLKATNLRVRWSPGERPEVVLLDLDGMRRVLCMTARRKLRGLMRLNVSLLQCPVVNHAGRLRMLLGYLRRPGAGRINFKPYWRLLEEWSARKLRRQIRSRRRHQRRRRVTRSPA